MQNSLLYHAAVQLMRRIGMLPAATVLFMRIASGPYTVAATVMLLFLTATSVMGLELQGTEGLPASLGLDIVLPPLYVGGMAFMQFLLLAAELFSPSLYLRIAISMLCPFWIFCYNFVIGPIGEPAWMGSFRQATSLIPAIWWTIQEICKDRNKFYVAVIVYSLLCFVTFVRACIASRRAVHFQSKTPLHKAIDKACSSLSRKAALLCRAGDADDLAKGLLALAATGSTRDS